MTKTTRNVLAGLAITVGTIGTAPAEAKGGLGTTSPLPIVRVRTNTAALATLIQEATDRSTTFRRLVEVINASDGIVYVSGGDCGHGVRACLAGVTAAGANRMLWVKVDTRKADWDLMGSIGHELRHAVEVLGNPKVTSNAAMYFFYEREGRTRGSSFETDAAVEAGNSVRDEVRRRVRLANAQ